MGQKFIYEDAIVYATIAGKVVTPKILEVEGRRVTIREVLRTRQGRLGTLRTLNFEVVGEDGLGYRLCFIPDEAIWYVEVLREGGARRKKK
ncbi:MAG: hypothetical protein ACYC6A_12075 [Armatimonadota bacterium]